MASTLTEERRVAWKIQGIGPDPAHILVVFKKSGTGNILHKVLEPGEVLKPGWFESPDSFLAYAVSKDENLRHSFSRKYQAVGQIWTFTLHFVLDFQVSKAKTLALKLDGGDPLRRLEEEISRVLSATARRLPWEALKRESADFGCYLLEAESTEGLGERRSNFERLQSFATSLGLDLRHVDVTRSLMEEDLQPDVHVRKVGIQMGVDSAQQVLELERDRLKQEREILGEQHRQERELLAIHGNQVLQGAERLRMVLDSVTKEGLRGFSQAVDGVRSFPAISDALQEIRTIQSSLMAVSAGPGSMPALGAAGSPLLPSVQTGPLLAEVRRPSDSLERLVTEAFKHLRVLDGNLADKRRILATSLHLLAEAALGREGDEEYLEGCCENLKQQLYPLESALEEEQLGFLRRIMDTERLRQDLA